MKHRLPSGVLAATAVALVALNPRVAAGEIVAVVSKDLPPYTRALAGFTRTLPGQPIEWLDRDEARAIARVKGRAPSVVVGIGANAARAVFEAMPGVPLVYCMVLDPDGLGLSAPRAVGVPMLVSLKDSVEAFRQAMPAALRLGAVVSSARAPRDIKEAQAAAAKAGGFLTISNAADAGEFAAAFERLVGHIDGFILVPDPSLVTHDTVKGIVAVAARRRVAVFAPAEEHVRLGALLGLVADFEQAGRDAASMARDIASGKKATELPPPRASWRFLVNLSTATAIGAKFTPEVLESAAKVR